MRSQKNTNATPRSPTPEDSPNPPSGGADGHPTPDRIVFAPLFDHENENIDPIAFSPGGTAQVTETEFVSAVLRAVDTVSGLRKNPNISSSKILLPSDLDPAYYSQHARPFWTVIRGNPVGIFVNCSQAEAAARDDTSSSIAGCLTWHATPGGQHEQCGAF
ncbi:hypothetical protein NLJ89_g11763 [Agrocybe chaxingu]|uniref:Uncharacterized protein n=1 Tax=Agrocybe chaxingu TaxID=84603 RepID=A0A9W8JN52_9AGAR|nr:hypothetical protein NLJ89_g11763 [Agrocybe chaxingu]